jgi:PPM family protein phosphatase
MNLSLRAAATGMTDVGLQRDHNEDSLVIVGEAGPFVVADGMGGHRAGDVASRIAIESIAEFFRDGAERDPDRIAGFDRRFSVEENQLLASIRLANSRILERSQRSRDLQGMGTTVVCAFFSPTDHRMAIAHVGDSRAYRLRDGYITQMTRDHSLFNDYLMAMPDLSEEQRSELPRNVITRALGMQDDIAIDLQTDQSRPGDIYILCSDGLSGMVEDDEMSSILTRATDLIEGCRLLVRRANENGGEDNVTALLIRVESQGDGVDKEWSAVSQPRDGQTLPSGPVELENEDTPPAGPATIRP